MHPSLVVDALEVVKVCAEKVIALVHGHDGACYLLSDDLAAWLTELVAKRPPGRGVLIAAVATLWVWVVNLISHVISYQ